MPKSVPFSINLDFQGVKDGEKLPDTCAYVFDACGRLLQESSSRDCQNKVDIPSELAGQTLRVVVGPPVGEGEPVQYKNVIRRHAYETRLRFDPKNPKVVVTLLDPVWRLWFLCACVVRGRLFQPLPLPDGTIQELPICNARVTICEIDKVYDIIWRLSEDLLFRIRKELFAVIPIPEPGPKQPFGPLPDPLPRVNTNIAGGNKLAPVFRTSALQLNDVETRAKLNLAAKASTPLELRHALADLSLVIRPYLCLWPWLEPWFVRYRADCFRTVAVDESGRFETTIHFPCAGDKPDLYFKAEQLKGGVWQNIYQPSIRCNTYWNYQCGTEIAIRVTNDCAEPCVPEDPIDPPLGITTWVMPWGVGGTRIWGTPLSGAPAPNGWVRSDGFTDYSEGSLMMNQAPFGGSLSFRQGHSLNIPNNGAKYYRWSYRKMGALTWHGMSTTVSRYYVKQSPGQLPTFPAYDLGPKTVGANSEPNLFEFRPNNPPLPDPGDPSGTITYWPTNNFFGDIYAAFLNTVSLAPDVAGAAGQYQILIEVFDSNGNLVTPGAGTFQFIVPMGVAADGVTIEARTATGAEVSAGGFIFNLQIDNNHCNAEIHAPFIGMSSTTDDCGFLRYDPMNTTPVTISFEGSHPNHHAVFAFSIVRGAVSLPNASVAHPDVSVLSVPPYTGDGVGNFQNSFARSELMCGPVDPMVCCVNAAFSENLRVRAKATHGWGQHISGYDSGDVRAFALAPVEEEE